MLQVFSKSIKNSELRSKILLTLFVIILYRLMASIPFININSDALAANLNTQTGTLLSTLNAFAGRGLTNLSIVAIGIYPYINASIIIQLLTKAIPHFEELSKEGAFGRQKLGLYTQWLTLPISIVQAFSVYLLFRNSDLVYAMNTLEIITLITSVTAGTFILMWLGGKITDFGIANGVSILIFVGIVSGFANSFASIYNYIIALGSTQLLITAAIIIIAVLAIISLVILINEGLRKIPIENAVSNNFTQTSYVSKSFFPIKINQTGVMPIIFASALLVVPTFLGSTLSTSTNLSVRSIGEWLTNYYTPTGSTISIYYIFTLFLLIFAFTYFYTSMAYNPAETADQLKKAGNYIPGVRPGNDTQKYIGYVVNRLNFAGGVFLGLVAIMPYIIQNFWGVQFLAIGGTGLLIIVSVSLETIRQLEAQVISKDYELVTV